MIMRIRETVSMLLAGMLLLQSAAPLASAEPAKPAAPVAQWTFDDQPTVQSLGVVRLDGDGPRAPVYAGFPADNRALVLEAPSWLAIPDEGQDSRFDFDNGDAITLEAWVRPDSIPGEHV
ncbi:MAG: hypothetical protein VX644_02335 [Planctomycetota bacterium]|nr:hypothetical protein [Planctomycetota bacterium]